MRHKTYCKGFFLPDGVWYNYVQRLKKVCFSFSRDGQKCSLTEQISEKKENEKDMQQ